MGLAEVIDKVAKGQEAFDSFVLGESPQAADHFGIDGKNSTQASS